MDKIEKILRKMGKKEQEVMMLLMLQIKADYTAIPGIKKLQGRRNLFRVRVGQYRLIFRVGVSGVEIVRITKRDE